MQACPSGFVKQLWYYIVGLMSNRAASLCKHECAPYCYATALLDDDADPRQEAAAQMMLADWKALCMIEQSEAVGAQDLAVEMQNCIYPPTRLAFLSLETGDRPGALELLRAMLQSFSDTKVIEDLHQRIRCDSLKNSNRKHTALEVQNIIMTSKILETRGIAHPAALTKKSFLSRWKKAKAEKQKSKFHCANEKLPAYYSKLGGP